MPAIQSGGLADLESGTPSMNEENSAYANIFEPICPLSNEPFRDPVVHPNGVTYEREAIEDSLADARCYPNRALKDYVDPSIGTKLETQMEGDGRVYCCPITKDAGNFNQLTKVSTIR